MINENLTSLVNKEPTPTIIALRKQGYINSQLGEREENKRTFLLSILYHEEGKISVTEVSSRNAAYKPIFNLREFPTQVEFKDYISRKDVKLGSIREI